MEESAVTTTESTPAEPVSEPVEENPKSTEELVAEQLMARIRKGKKVLTACEKGLAEGLKVNGKTLKEWSQELRVMLPEDPDDITGLERAQNEASNKFQIAEGITAFFEMQSRAIGNSHEAGFARRYVEEMDRHKGEKVAAEKLRNLVAADVEMDAALSAAQSAELIAEFFKKLSRGLEEVRKAIENRGRFLTLRAKLNSLT